MRDWVSTVQSLREVNEQATLATIANPTKIIKREEGERGVEISMCYEKVFYK